MKKVTNWIKHEYRIYKDIDKPTYRDYFIIRFLFWFICLPVCACLWILLSTVLVICFPSLQNVHNDLIIYLILGFIYWILISFFVLPVYYLVNKNSLYEL